MSFVDCTDSFVTFADRKFCVKARLSQALGVTLHLIRTYIGHAKIVNYLVQVLKLYSANG